MKAVHDMTKNNICDLATGLLLMEELLESTLNQCLWEHDFKKKNVSISR